MVLASQQSNSRRGSHILLPIPIFARSIFDYDGFSASSDRILKNEIGRSVLNKLLDDEILSLQGSHYILDPDGLNAHLGVTWPDLRKGEMPESLFNYLREID